MTGEQQKLLVADLWPTYTFADPNRRIERFHKQARPAYKRLIEGLILYDQVVIPTQDFLTLTSLVSVLGERSVIELFDAGSVRFLRLKGTLIYTGNGGGIKSCEMFGGKDRHAPHAFCAPLEHAVDFALSGLSDQPKDRALRNLVLNATDEVDLLAMEEAIRHETYMDVLNSDHLRSVFAIRNRSMDHLAGIAPDGVRTFGGAPCSDHWQVDEIDAVLAIAFANLELRLSQIAHCLDASTVSPIGHLLRAKIERTLGAEKANTAFANLKEVAGIPDIGEGIIEKQFPIADLIKLRHSSNGEQFRRWFHEKCSDNPRETAREYCALLREIPRVQSLPARVLRFLATTLAGFLPGGPIFGTAAGTVDSFFIEQWLRGPSPKYFIEALRQLQI